MKIVGIKSLAFSEVKVIKFQRFKDDRGFFSEIFRESDFKKIIPDFQIHQANISYSKKRVIRGLHFQWDPYMGKLVRTVEGHMVDIVLDIRLGSSTFGKVIGYNMKTSSDWEFNEWIWVPPGFAHGNFYFEESKIEYFCSTEYAPEHEAGINPLADDIDWSLCDKEIKSSFNELNKQGFIISEKDKNGLTIEEWKKDERSRNFTYK